MKYAVLGTGMVGHTLATKLVSLGHEVRMGAREAGNAKATEWASTQGGTAGHGSFAEVAAWADRVVFAVNGAQIEAVAAAVGDDAVAGKTVIDVTNPLDMSVGFPPSLLPELSNTTSLGEALQAALPGAHVVKTLNTMNCDLMVDPTTLPGDHDVLLCGNDPGAKSTVSDLLGSFGWSAPIDLGGLEAARGLEALMLFWLRMYGVVGHATFNYKIQRG